MFDISFGEILLIAIVALVVLGPERLPTVARTLGAIVGRIQRFIATVKMDIQQPVSELESLRQEFNQAANEFRNKVNHEVQDVQSSIQHHADSIETALKQIETPPENPPTSPHDDATEHANHPNKNELAEGAETPLAVASHAEANVQVPVAKPASGSTPPSDTASPLPPNA